MSFWSAGLLALAIFAGLDFVSDALKEIADAIRGKKL